MPERDEDYGGRTREELEDAILARCKDMKPSERRADELRAMGYCLLVLCTGEKTVLTGRTMDAMAALLGVGGSKTFPLVAPADIHRKDAWVRAVTTDGIYLNIAREGRLTPREETEWAVALNDGFGTSDEFLAGEVGVRADDIFTWRKGRGAAEYRKAIEFVAKSMQPGPGHPDDEPDNG